MAKQLFLNYFGSRFVASVKDAPTTGTPETELDYGVLRLSDGAAGTLLNPTGGDWYVLTAFKRSGSDESSVEIMRCTAVDNATPGECRITVLRGQEGTTPQAYVSGDFVEMRFTRGGAERFIQVGGASDLPASGIAFTPAGSVAATDVQTAIQELDGEKEPKAAAGTAAQYWRGDKSWRDFFTDVRAATLTGLSTATNAAITAADTVLVALGKLQRQITDHVGLGGAAHAAATTATAGFMSAADKTNLDAAGAAIGTLGTAATKNTGTSGGTVPLLNTANSWSGRQDMNGGAQAKYVHFGGGGYYSAGNSGAAKTIDFVNGQKQMLGLTANCTITLTAPGPGNYQLILVQDATGGRSVTWAAQGGVVVFVGSATAPEINTGASSYTMVSLFFDGAGTGNSWLSAAKVNA